MEVVLPGEVCKLVCFEAHGALWHVSPARRSGSEFRLAAQEQCQAIMQRPDLLLLALDVRCVQGFDDISKIGLLVFLELWLGTYP